MEASIPYCLTGMYTHIMSVFIYHLYGIMNVIKTTHVRCDECTESTSFLVICMCVWEKFYPSNNCKSQWKQWTKHSTLLTVKSK